MYRIVFGNHKVGCQGMFFFETQEEGHEFGEDERRYLRLLRREKRRPSKRNTVELEYIFKKWSQDRMLANFLKRLEELVDEEMVNPSCWEENGEFF